MKKYLTPKTALLFAFLAIQATFGSAQTYQKLHDFNGADGSASYSQLISDGTHLYGMTLLGGINNKGTIFKIKKDGTGFTKLFDFGGTDGEKPYSALALVGTELFGVTHAGGTASQGVLFKIKTNGTNYTKLIDFASGNNGQKPHSQLYFDGTFLWGTTTGGGIGGAGLLFKIKPDGSGYAETFNFYSTNHASIGPEFDLAFDGTYFYGATFNGNTIQNSTIYKVKPDGTGFQKLYDFPDTMATTNVQSSGLLIHNGYLYSNTLYSETTQDGYLYKIKTDGTDFSVLHDFDVTTGHKPSGELIVEGAYLYGTTSSGGTNGGGTIFRIKPDGTDFSTVFDFSTNDGYAPWTGLFSDGNSLYGITIAGGTGGDGTIFKFNDNNITAIAPFPGDDAVNLYPNPASTSLTIEIQENADMQIVDVSGKTIASKQLNKGNNTIDISHFAPGTYFLQTGKGQAVKFLKE